MEICDRSRMSLIDLNYEIPLIGFSCDSDTSILLSGLEDSRIIAKKNGPKLVEFIFDLKGKCPDTDVSLFQHSLAAIGVLSSLDCPTNNPDWNDN
jgi:hypothetical protein